MCSVGSVLRHHARFYLAILFYFYAYAKVHGGACSSVLDLGVRKAVIIHCVERVVWMDANRDVYVIEVELVRPEEIASNLGAGDAFCAGLLYGIH